MPVGNGVQIRQRVRITKYNSTKFLSAQVPIFIKDLRPEPGRQLLPHGNAGTQQLMVHPIAVRHRPAQLPEHVQHGGFSRPGWPGDADDNHAPARSSQARAAPSSGWKQTWRPSLLSRIKSWRGLLV